MTSFYTQLLPIVVLYKQRMEESLTLLSLNKNLAVLGIRMDVFIYDNSPERQYEQSEFDWENFHILYLHDPANGGLSKAYNTGAANAGVLGKKWLLLLDQDTTFSVSLLGAYETALAQNAAISLFAPILKLKNEVLFSPCIAKHKRGYPPQRLSAGIQSLWKLSPVNSGMLVSLLLYNEVGGYNEKVKVDFCDFQFLEKVRRVNPAFYLTDTVGIQDYSAFEYSLSKQKNRFKQYLEDALNCEKPSFGDQCGFFYTVLRHTMGLTYKMRDTVFIGLFIRNFLFR